MKYVFACFLLLLAGCKSRQDYHRADSALEAGREFIDACLKGDFGKASFYMLDDAENRTYLDKTENEYRNNDRESRQQFRQASINIIEVDDVDEHTTIINYRNSFDQVGHKIKVIRKANDWLVDFKYTFNPNL